MASAEHALKLLDARIASCGRCERLRSYCMEIGQVRRRAYRDQAYWARPVPGFGPADARVLLVGLAPGAHGSNRTGRPFTGDGSGNFMYPLLYQAGFASQAAAHSRDDGMKLSALRINSVGRCAPPDNKPTTEELHNCAAFLDEEIALLRQLRVIVCLGGIAWSGVLGHFRRTGVVLPQPLPKFAHGAEFALARRDGGTMHVLGCYHPSLQNTNTGRLTASMMLRVFLRARELAGLDKQS